MSEIRPEEKFMRQAVEEMKQSRSEHDQKVDPMVGAVLVNEDGELIGSEHRGNLRKGNHAEYVLIDRVLHDQNLENTILYVTLEPCTERSENKIPCVKRIVNARINKVVIGILDPNPDIKGNGVTYLQDHDVKIEFFDPEYVEEIKQENLPFIQYWEDQTNEDDFLDLTEVDTSKEKELIERSSLVDIDWELVEKYFSEMGLDVEVPSDEAEEYLHKNGYLGISDDQFVPTFAGLVLFGIKPAEIIHHSRVLFTFSRDGNESYKEFERGLVALPEALESIFTTNARSITTIEGMERKDTPEFPLEAFREAIVNAVAHRDYSIDGAKVQVKVENGLVTIESPGLPIQKLEKIRSFEARPVSRNQRISYVLSKLRYMEERGSGLSRMRDELTEYGLAEPVFNVSGGYFVVKIFGHSDESYRVLIKDDWKEKLTSAEANLLRFIITEDEVKTSRCAEEFDVSSRHIRRRLNTLLDEGLIEQLGKGPSTRYTFFEREG
jgi:ATP-dependent DNA helicase RecG